MPRYNNTLNKTKSEMKKNRLFINLIYEAKLKHPGIKRRFTSPTRFAQKSCQFLKLIYLYSVNQVIIILFFKAD